MHDYIAAFEVRFMNFLRRTDTDRNRPEIYTFVK